jgi:hypothetical protein
VWQLVRYIPLASSVAVGKLYAVGGLCDRWQAGGSLGAAACVGPSVRIGYPREMIPRPHFAREGSRGSFSLFIAAQAAAQL